jgi:hypothetical protein
VVVSKVRSMLKDISIAMCRTPSRPGTPGLLGRRSGDALGLPNGDASPVANGSVAAPAGGGGSTTGGAGKQEAAQVAFVTSGISGASPQLHGVMVQDN